MNLNKLRKPSAEPRSLCRRVCEKQPQRKANKKRREDGGTDERCVLVLFAKEVS